MNKIELNLVHQPVMMLFDNPVPRRTSFLAIRSANWGAVILLVTA